MSVSADDARAKVIHCEALDDKQKAKMLLLINTEPDTTLPVFTGVPDFLLGHTLSVHLEGMTTGTTPTAHAIALYLHTSSALRLLLLTLNMGLQHLGSNYGDKHPNRWQKVQVGDHNCIALSEHLINHMSVHAMLVACSCVASTQRF